MAKVTVEGIDTVVDYVKTETQSYYLKVQFVDEGTDDDKIRTVGHMMSSILRDVDFEDTDLELDDLGGGMRKSIKWENDNLVPHSRRELTFALIQVAIDRLMERFDTDGEIERIVNVEVEERVTVRKTPYEHQDYK